MVSFHFLINNQNSHNKCLGGGSGQTIRDAKILKVDIGPRVEFLSCLYKGIDKLVVPLAANPLLAKAEVQIVLQQFLVVRATV